ncbi:hypothetical protein BD626DRAFT_625173 [Schizophyllum amplum]|uniref:Uncharacterized protein n=1 Tax=Schizophyllum amplum TaxID=97359 RepID=A0A550CYL6_9AGAR|nr:hypothetical protein BD626DRAFT_625173 [Auriculariopsis ampla]
MPCDALTCRPGSPRRVWDYIARRRFLRHLYHALSSPSSPDVSRLCLICLSRKLENDSRGGRNGAARGRHQLCRSCCTDDSHMGDAHHTGPGVLICDRGLNLSTLYNYDLHESTLRAWYIVQPIMAHVCMLSVEALMMARVYGMYHRRTRVLLLFLLVLLLDTIVVVVGVAVNVPSFDQITRAYFVRYSSPALSYFGVSSFITQVLILTFMMLSYRREWRTTPLVQLIVRDGLLVFGVFVVFCACMTVYPVMHFFATAAAYPWLLTSISCAGCRLILNMQTVPEATAPASSALVQLTTYYTIPPQTLDDNEQQDGS